MSQREGDRHGGGPEVSGGTLFSQPSCCQDCGCSAGIVRLLRDLATTPCSGLLPRGLLLRRSQGHGAGQALDSAGRAPSSSSRSAPAVLPERREAEVTGEAAGSAACEEECSRNEDSSSREARRRICAGQEEGSRQPPVPHGATCRICLEEGTEEDELLSPCVCRGSAKYVHLGCIEAAFMARAHLLDVICPTCKHHYEGPAAVHIGKLAVKELEENYGENHVYVAAALHNLGISYGLLGDAEQERDLLERALAIQEREHGPDHCDVATTLANLGNAYDRLGDLARQRELLERALKINEREYGADHHAVATTLVNLGSVHGRLGDHTRQRDILERAHRIMEREFGPNSHKVTASLVNLSLAYGALGDMHRQRDLLERALRINEQEYGPDHRAVANTLLNLGNVYGCLGDAERKRDLLLRALRIKQREYGPDHHEVAKALVSLGNAYGDLGMLEEQREFLERALSIQRRHFGPDHRELLSSLTGLSTLYDRLKDIERKKDLLEQSLRIMERGCPSVLGRWLRPRWSGPWRAWRLRQETGVVGAVPRDHRTQIWARPSQRGRILDRDCADLPEARKPCTPG